MVLAHKVGRERPFPLVVLLYVVTFGIYGVYWHYKAHDEVYKQFELHLDGKDQGIVWLILGYIIFSPLLFVYHWIFVSNVRDTRRRLGHEQNLSPGLFLALVIGAAVIWAIVFFVVIVVFVGAALDELGRDASDEEVLDALFEGFAEALPLLAITWLVVSAVQLTAYGLLQRDLNGLWRSYDSRVTELS